MDEEQHPAEDALDNGQGPEFVFNRVGLGEIRNTILENPDLVLEDRELMDALLGAGAAPVADRNIVDLRDKLVDRLEDRLDRLEETNRQVLAAAYENLAGTNQVHRAILHLLTPASFRSFLTTLGDEVMDILDVEAIRLGLETATVRPGAWLGPQGPHASLVTALPRGGVAAYLGDQPDVPLRRVTLRRTTDMAEDVFGHGPGWIQSEALIRLDLGSGTNPALLAMGSEDPQRFTPDQGTDLLSFFGGSLERLLRRWLA